MICMALELMEHSKVRHRLLGKKTILTHNKCYRIVQVIWPNRKGTTDLVV